MSGHLLLVQGHRAAVAGAPADQDQSDLVDLAGLEPRRPVVHVYDGDGDGGGGGERRPVCRYVRVRVLEDQDCRSFTVFPERRC